MNTYEVALRDQSTVEVEAHSVDLFDDVVVLYEAPNDNGDQKARAVFPKQAVYGVWPKSCTRSFD